MTLAPCPFCDVALELRGGVNPYGRHPKDTGCIGERMAVINIPLDVEAWNRRAALTQRDEHIRVLTEALEQRDDLLIRAEKLRFGKYLTVESRGPSQWAVCESGMVLNASGDFEYEPMPSNREPEFIARTRFTFADAVTKATALAASPAEADGAVNNG